MIVRSKLSLEDCIAKTDCETNSLTKPIAFRVSDDNPLTTWTEIRATDLLNQQIWCWGQDVKYSGGNLLTRYGFQRKEKPRDSGAVSLYRLEISSTVRVILRGFGVFYGDDRWGGLFVRRMGYSPKLTPTSDLPRPAWKAEDLPPLTEPSNADFARAQRLLLELIDWIRHYEVWILKTVGINYRRESLIAWNPKDYRVIPTEEMASAWRILGVTVAESNLPTVSNSATHENDESITAIHSQKNAI